MILLLLTYYYALVNKQINIIINNILVCIILVYKRAF